jgi:hypothetical protein
VADPIEPTTSDGGGEGFVAAFFAVIGAILFVSGLATIVYGVISKPIGVQFMAAGLLFAVVGAGFVAHAVELDRG